MTTTISRGRTAKTDSEEPTFLGLKPGYRKTNEISSSTGRRARRQPALKPYSPKPPAAPPWLPPPRRLRPPLSPRGPPPCSAPSVPTLKGAPPFAFRDSPLPPFPLPRCRRPRCRLTNGAESLRRRHPGYLISMRGQPRRGSTPPRSSAGSRR
jgi:hypothetical protein